MIRRQGLMAGVALFLVTGGAVAQEKEADPKLSETHVVERGDTLWDLCSKYLNSPWYWPKIWSYNPQITNAHWIYPGNEIQFYPTDENLPTNIDASAETELPEDLEPVKTVGKLEVGRIVPNSVQLSYSGFVGKEEHNYAGEIRGSPSPAQILDDFDRIYVKFSQTPDANTKYAIYRMQKPLYHPTEGDLIGYSVEVIGRAKLVDAEPKLAKMDIVQAFRVVERGDFVAEWPQHWGERVSPVPNEADLDGYIVDSLGEAIGALGEHHIVFIDKGRTDGVQKGNTLTILHRGDPFIGEMDDFPDEEFGQVLVIDVAERASTAVITRSLREVQVGDRVEMRRRN